MFRESISRKYIDNKIETEIAATIVDESQIYHVGKHGDDTNDGKTKAKALLTFGQAITLANAQTPASDNKFVILCEDAGIYVENITLESYIFIRAATATITGNMTVEDHCGVYIKKITCSSGVAIWKKTGFTDGTNIFVNNMILSGTAIGLLVQSGFATLRCQKMTVANGFGIGDTSDQTGTVHAIVNEIKITGDGYGVGSVGAGELSIQIDCIHGQGTSTALATLTTGTINAIVGHIHTTNAYNVAATGTLNLICADLIGNKVGAGTINAVEASDLADAVTKKHANTLDHTQDTDQKLDNGGVSEVTAAEALAGYDHSVLVAGNPHVVTKAEVGAIADVVEDTTPELGGEMDAGEHTIGFTEKANVSAANAVTIDWRASNKQLLTLDENTTITFTAPSNPCSLTLRIVQDGDNNTVTFPTVKTVAGGGITNSESDLAIDIFSFYFDGTNYYAIESKLFS